ncbi:TPA: hypothetical protein HA244_04555 [Candidatus Micrarchaeota archaeon]|nr:hypothetical protein [Candidatus Micrarchaeota archaeon]
MALNKFSVLSLFFLLSASFLLAGCTSSPNATVTPAPSASPIASGTVGASPSVPPGSTPSVGQSPSPAANETKEFSIVARQFSFTPSEIRVSKGDKVRLTIDSVDTTHGFSLPDFGISATLAPGKQTVIEFVASKAGTFAFSCNVFCGSGHSEMSGSLIVEG